MKSSIKYCGWVGVGVALLLSFAALCASLAFPKQVGSAWHVATYPVTKAWEAFFRTLEGDHAMMFILPMLATQLLFVLAVGFGVGAILSLVFGPRDADLGASPNSAPAERLGDSGVGGGPRNTFGDMINPPAKTASRRMTFVPLILGVSAFLLWAVYMLQRSGLLAPYALERFVQHHLEGIAISSLALAVLGVALGWYLGRGGRRTNLLLWGTVVSAGGVVAHLFLPL